MARLLLLVDVQNLYHSIRQQYGLDARVDFARLREDAKGGRKFTSTRTVAYISAVPNQQRPPLQMALQRLNYEVRVVPSRLDGETLRDTDTDELLLHDGFRSQFGAGDVVVVASGDSDMVPLYQHLGRRGCRIEVIGVEGTVSHSIYNYVDEVRLLDEGILFDAPAKVAD
jgi:uncharacterized LabA/DUF88 family protein